MQFDDKNKDQRKSKRENWAKQALFKYIMSVIWEKVDGSEIEMKTRWIVMNKGWQDIKK